MCIYVRAVLLVVRGWGCKIQVIEICFISNTIKIADGEMKRMNFKHRFTVATLRRENCNYSRWILISVTFS